MPFGDLEVYLEGAINIKDTTLFGKGSPYCILTCGSQMVKTEPVQEGGSSPFWGRSFNFKIDRSTNELNIKIWNKNFLRDDDVLGETTLSFQTVFHGGHSLPVTSYTVTRPSGRVHGDVRLGLRFLAKERPKDYQERPQHVPDVPPPRMQHRPLQSPPAIGRMPQYAHQADDEEGFNSDISRSSDSYGGHPASIIQKKVVSFRSVDDNASDEGSGRHYSDRGGYGAQRSRFAEPQDVDPYGSEEPYDAEYQNVPPPGGPQQPMPPPPGGMDGPGHRQPFPQRQGRQQPVRTAHLPPQDAPPGEQQRYAAPAQVPQQPTHQRSREQNPPSKGHDKPILPPGPRHEQHYKYEEASFGTQGRRSNPPGQQPRRANVSSLPGSASHSPFPAYDERVVDHRQEGVRQTSDGRFEGRLRRPGSGQRSPTPSFGEARSEAPRALPPQLKVPERELPRPPGSRNRRTGLEERSPSPSVEPPGASLQEEACEATGHPRFSANLLTKSGSGTLVSPSYDARADDCTFADLYTSSPPAIRSETAASPDESVVAAKVFNSVIPNSSLPCPPGKTSGQTGHPRRRVSQREMVQVMSVPTQISESLVDFSPAQQSPQIGEDTGPVYKSFRNRQPENQQDKQRRDWEQEQPCQQAPPFSQRPASVKVEDDSDADSQGSMPSRTPIKSLSLSEKNREQLQNQQQPQQAPPHLQPPVPGDVEDDSDSGSQGSLPSTVSQKSMSSHNSKGSKLSSHSQKSGSALSASGSGRNFTHPSMHRQESSQHLNSASRHGVSATPLRPKNLDQPSVQVQDTQPLDATSPATPQTVGPGSFSQPPAHRPRPPQHLNVGNQRPPAPQREGLKQLPEFGRGGPQLINTSNQGGLYMDQPQLWQETGGPQPYYTANNLGTQVSPTGKILIQLPEQGRGGLRPLLKPGSQGPLPVSPVGPPNQPTVQCPRGPRQSRQNRLSRPTEYQPAQPSEHGGGGPQSDQGRPMAEQLAQSVRQGQPGPVRRPPGHTGTQTRMQIPSDHLMYQDPLYPPGDLVDSNFEQPVGQASLPTLPSQPLYLNQGLMPSQGVARDNDNKRLLRQMVGRDAMGHASLQVHRGVAPPRDRPAPIFDSPPAESGQSNNNSLLQRDLDSDTDSQSSKESRRSKKSHASGVSYASNGSTRRIVPLPLDSNFPPNIALSDIPPITSQRNPSLPRCASDSTHSQGSKSSKKSSLSKVSVSTKQASVTAVSQCSRESGSRVVFKTSYAQDSTSRRPVTSTQVQPLVAVEGEDQGSISENENPGSPQKSDNNCAKNSDGGRSGQEEEEDGTRSLRVGITKQGETQGSDEEKDGSEKATGEQDIDEDRELENKDYHEAQVGRATGRVGGHEYYDGIVTQAVVNCDDSNDQLEEDDSGETGGHIRELNLVESSEQSCTMAVSTYSGAETASIHRQTCSVDVAIETKDTVDYEADPVGGDQLTEVYADPDSYDVGEENQVTFTESDEAYNVECQYGTGFYDYGRQGGDQGWEEGRDDSQFNEEEVEPEEEEYDEEDVGQQADEGRGYGGGQEDEEEVEPGEEEYEEEDAGQQADEGGGYGGGQEDEEEVEPGEEEYEEEDAGQQADEGGGYGGGQEDEEEVEPGEEEYEEEDAGQQADEGGGYGGGQEDEEEVEPGEEEYDEEDAGQQADEGGGYGGGQEDEEEVEEEVGEEEINDNDNDEIYPDSSLQAGNEGRISSQTISGAAGAGGGRGRPQRNLNGQRRTSQPPQRGQGSVTASRNLVSGHPIDVTPDPSSGQFYQGYSDLSPPRYSSPQIGPGPTPYYPPQYADNNPNHGSEEPHARLQNWLQTSANSLPPEPSGPPVCVPPGRPPPQVQSYSAVRTTQTREVNHSYCSSDNDPSYQNFLLRHQHQKSQIPTDNLNADMPIPYNPTPRFQRTKMNGKAMQEFCGSAFKKVSPYVGPILAIAAAEVTKSVLGVGINDQDSNGWFSDGADTCNQGGDPSYVLSTQDDGNGFQATNLDTAAIDVMTDAMNAYSYAANQGPRPPGNMMRGAPMQRPMQGMPPGMRGRGPMRGGPPRHVQGGYRPTPGALPRPPPNQQMGS